MEPDNDLLSFLRNVVDSGYARKNKLGYYYMKHDSFIEDVSKKLLYRCFSFEHSEFIYKDVNMLGNMKFKNVDIDDLVINHKEPIQTKDIKLDF